MCTLTIYPKPNNTGFTLTFNRDEKPERSSILIEQNTERGLIYPKDALHGGTWLAFNPSEMRFACLLNGAFELHRRQLPYRRSRGLVVLDSFEYADVLTFGAQYDFTGIEPFTMVFGQHNLLMELRWDGLKQHIKILDNTTPHIYSSCTLYNKTVRQWRENLYAAFLKTKRSPKTNDLWAFHQTTDALMPENALLMQRPNGPCTVSISQLDFHFLSQTIDFKYHELGKHKTHVFRFDTNRPTIALAS
jgi:hypothetical protein